MTMEKGIKTIFVGPPNVGKTSLFNRLLNDTFSEHELPTLKSSNNVIKQQKEGVDVLFSLWDTAGQEKYRSLIPMYVSNAGLALFVFDLTNKQSLLEVKDIFESLRERIPDECRIILIGNKSDASPIEATIEDSTIVKHEILASEYFETSAKDGTGIQELLRGMTEIVDLKFQQNIVLIPNDKHGNCC